jgi:glutamyl-tRNA reductase
MVEAESHALGLLASRADIRPTELTDVVYAPRNCDAARQLFRVSAGLESMIVGEAEVQGQVRRAHETAIAAGTDGPLVNRLFHAALHTGGRVRSETAIGAGGASVSSVAVDLASDTLGDLSEKHVVIIGAGETAELTAAALAAEGVTTVFVANRRADRARSLAERFGGSVLPLDRLPEQLEHADMVVASTASPHAIVGAEELGLVMELRRGRPLLVLDIAVPRDVEHACADLDGVTLVDIDGLQQVVARNLDVREAEARRAEEIVEDELTRFASWLSSLDAVPTIRALREHGDAIVEQVLAENAGRWEGASPRDLARIEAIARAVMQRLLHEPTIRLKSVGHGRQQLARELFGIEEGTADVVEEQDNVRSLRRHGA